MRVLVTGVTGFVGGHLAEALLRAGPPAGGAALLGASRSGVWPKTLAHLAGSVELAAVDLTDAAALESYLDRAGPDQVYHLAGYANTGKSFREPDACWRENLGGTRLLYSTLAKLKLAPRVVYISTGLIYGDSDAPDVAVTESAPFKPASPYAASKAAADLVSYQVFRTDKLPVLRARPFTQAGPRQASDYAVANFARQIAAAEAGKIEPVIRTGSLDAHRDYADVRDVVSALVLLMARGEPGAAYNVGTGSTVAIGEVLRRLVAMARVPVEVVSEADPSRAGDVAITRVDAARLRRDTGWAPQYALDQTLSDTLDYWRAVARGDS